VAVNNSIKVDPLVFLLSMFVITENIMKRPVYIYTSSLRETTSLTAESYHVTGSGNF